MNDVLGYSSPAAQRNLPLLHCQVSLEDFEYIRSHSQLIYRALSGRLVVPDFEELRDDFSKLYEKVRGGGTFGPCNIAIAIFGLGWLCCPALFRLQMYSHHIHANSSLFLSIALD